MDATTPIEEAWKTLQDLIRQGKVRNGGISNHTVDLIERAERIGPVTAKQPQYNPLQRKIEKDILSFSLSHHIGVLGWRSLAEGSLSDTYSLASLDPTHYR